MEFRAHEMGGSPCAAIWLAFAPQLLCRPHSRAEILLIHVDLGFRSQSLAPPQALCLRLLRRLKPRLYAYACFAG